MWSSRTAEPYQSLTVHFIDEDFNLRARCLQTTYFPDDHTGENIAAGLREGLVSWDLHEENHVCITTDNASNMVLAARLNEWTRLQCFGHRLHLAIVLAEDAEDTDLTKSIKTKVLAYLNNKYGDPNIQELLDVACFLDPRFKIQYISTDNIPAIKTRLKTEIVDLAQRTYHWVFNKQLESQCSELSSALRSLSVEKSKLQTEHQASIKAERSRVAKQLHEQDLLLEEARRNIQAELKGALSAKVKLQMELETLKVDHAQLLQSSTVAQETVVTQRELLERTIERLRGDLDSAVKEGEVVRTDRDSAKTEMCIVVTKLECERSALETQLAKVKLEAGTLSSTLQKQEEENRRLMGKLVAMEHQQNAQQQVEQMLKELTDIKNNLAYEKGKLQTRVDQLQEELQALRDTHVESVQQHKLSSVLEDKYTQVSSEMSTLKTTCHKLEAQLRQAQAAVQVKEGEVTSVVAARDEALRDSRTLRGQLDKLQEQHGDKLCELEGWLGVSRQGGGSSVAQTLENVLASHSHLQHNTETTAESERDENYRPEVEKLQDIMATTHSKINKMLETLHKALVVARLDNKKLAQSLEQAVLANSTLQAKLDRARDQHRTPSHRERWSWLKPGRDWSMVRASGIYEASDEEREGLSEEVVTERNLRDEKSS
ncbi:hypothetical protein J4Q44_G00338110 [Coregonus suidteri]|uniref:Uncharacterized protein n=1 Tax=Coregonus suidteri TaxID=861788 RepID=A0AAN8KR66_9TELE